ncbi:hypothetical protein M758_2G109600 [Ceratodon purpureus]|nr:hypothetical protein M758_2G109600 [Ceratodon purpureus]
MALEILRICFLGSCFLSQAFGGWTSETMNTIGFSHQKKINWSTTSSQYEH